MKKINKWIALFVATMFLHIIITFFAPVGEFLVADILRIIVNIVNATAFIYVFIKIFQRDEMIWENETIKTLIYYKEQGKQKNFPVSATILLIYSLSMLANIIYMCMVTYYSFFMKG